MPKLYFILFFILGFQWIVAQSTIPINGDNFISIYISPITENQYSYMMCDYFFEVHHGANDWESNPNANKVPRDANESKTLHAITCANLNNTDGDFDSGVELIDANDPDVSNSTLGRIEQDLVKFVVRSDISGTHPDFEIFINSAVEIAVWEEPNKTVSFWSGTSGSFNISSSNIDKEYFIEVKERSEDPGDIQFILKTDEQDPVMLDEFKITAIWIDLANAYYTRESDVDPLDDLDISSPNHPIYKFNLKTWRASDNSYYGFGDARNDDSHIAGRILFEYQLEPNDPETYEVLMGTNIKFDIARQVNKQTLISDYFSLINSEDSYERYPFDAGQDNELPNDDLLASDEQRQLRPSLKFYSFDAPSRQKALDPSEDEIDETTFVETRSNYIRRDNFLEWVRIKFDENSFPSGLELPEPISGNQVIGSRASEKIEWYCANYLTATNNFYEYKLRSGLAEDYAIANIQPSQSMMTGNGTLTVTGTNTNNKIYDFSYASSSDDWLFLVNSGIDPLPFADIISESSPGIWTYTYDGYTFTITEGTTPFESDDTFFFINRYSVSSLINSININIQIDHQTSQ